jgi:exonuclease SbcC
MKLENLSIHGLLRFADTVTIDCTSLPVGLIALVGPNGSGKTTLMEAALAALFRSFPSREKELFDYAHDRDSFVEAAFSLDGTGTYRARVNVDGVKRLSEAVLTHDGEPPLNNGLVSTFDAAVARVFPPREVLLASAFSAQNKAGSFISLDRKGRKQLFAQLLGLDHLEAMAQTARTAAGLVETARGKLAAVREVLARGSDVEIELALDNAGAVITLERARTDAGRRQLQAEIVDAEATLATVADQVAAYAVATQRVQSLEREQLAAEAQRTQAADLRAGVTTALDAEVLRLENARNRGCVDLDTRRAKSGRTLVDELAAIEAKLVATLADFDARIGNNRDLLARADEIRAAVAQIATFEVSLADDRRSQQTFRDQIAALDAEDRDVLVPALAKATTAKQHLELAQMNAALLGTVPCGGAGDFSGCKFLTNAKAAADRIPGFEAEAAGIAETEAARKMLATTRATAKGFADGCAVRIVQFEARKTDLAKAAKLEPSIAAAEARIAELMTAKADAMTSAGQAAQDADARAADRSAEILTARATLEATTTQAVTEAKERAEDQAVRLDDQLEGITEQLADLAQRLLAAQAGLGAAAAGNQQAAQLQAALAILRGRWDATTAELGRLDGAERDLERRRQELATRRAELADVERRIRLLDTELLDWQLLAKALGRDGLPVLEIDAAGPTVTAFANDLLASCFGPRFSLELVTQEAKASGKGVKEAFNIIVLDNERGGDARDIGDLSGGEQIIVGEALANAISLFVNQRNGSAIRTCWRDETTGPLDAENAARYVPMLRRLRELGGFAQIFFVSHNSESAAMADAQLVFSDGRVTVALPPYAA